MTVCNYSSKAYREPEAHACELGQNPSPTAGSFVRPNRKSDKSYGFLDALRKKYAPSDLDELTDKGAIKISGKTVEEVGFEKISQQLANLHELRIVVLDGLCIHGILPQRNDAYIDNGKQESREIEESRTGEPQNQEWKLALRELEELSMCHMSLPSLLQSDFSSRKGNLADRCRLQI